MAVFDTELAMNRAKAVLFSLLMIAASLAGCIGGEDVDTSDYENQIAEKDKSIDELESIIINQNEQLNNSVNNVSMLQAQLEQSIMDRDDLLNQSNISVNELNQQLNNK